jgi:hypothetical protein
MPDPRRLLIEVDGDDVVFELLQSAVVIGRDAGVDLPLEDPKISKRHCEVRAKDGRLTLRDLGSTNGTFVNGVQVSNAELKAGDVVTVGDRVLHVDRRKGGSKPAPAPTAVAAAPSAPAVAAAVPATTSSSAAPAALPAAPPAPAVAPAASGGGRRLVAAAFVLGAVGVFATVFRGSGRPPAEDARLEQGRARLSAVGAIAAERGPRAALDELDDLARTYGELGLADEIARRRAAVEAAYAAPAPPPTNGPVRRVEVMPDAPRPATPGDVDAEFVALLGAHRYVEAGRLAERSPHREQLVRALEAALRAERTEVETEYAQRRTQEGDEAARRWLSTAVGRFPVTTSAYADLQTLLLTGVVASRPSAPADGAAPAADVVAKDADPPEPAPAPKPAVDVPAGDALKTRLADAERFLADGDLPAAQALLADLKVAAAAGGHLALGRDVERGLRSVAAEESFRAAIVRTVTAGAKIEAPLGEGRLGQPTAADSAGVVFDVGGVPTPYAWRTIPATAYVACAERLPLSPLEKIDAAVALFLLGKEESATRLLVRAYEKLDEAGRKRLDAALADARRVAVPAEGFRLVADKFLGPAEFRRHELNLAVDRAKKDLENADPAKRRAAFDAMAALGADARAAFQTALLARRAALDEALKKDAAHKKLAALRDQRVAIDAKRKVLLDLIFDEEKYPYPYRPPEATAQQYMAYVAQQNLIDEQTAPLKKAWTAADAAKIDPAYRKKLEQLAEIAAWMKEAEFPFEKEEPAFYTLLPAEGDVTVRTLALDAEDRERIDASAAIMEKNGFHPTASKGEIEQARLTNEYRLMLGRRAVVLYGPLVAAARGHCKDMATHGFFSHQSPVPGKTWPADRMKLEGIDPRGGSENIARANGPQGAFEGWRRSSGHHRNMVTAGWRYFGVGNEGNFWCQKFIVADGNLRRDGAEKGE